MQKEKRKKNREKGTKKKERKKNREMHKETGIKRKKGLHYKTLKSSNKCLCLIPIS